MADVDGWFDFWDFCRFVSLFITSSASSILTSVASDDANEIASKELLTACKGFVRRFIRFCVDVFDMAEVVAVPVLNVVEVSVDIKVDVTLEFVEVLGVLEIVDAVVGEGWTRSIPGTIAAGTGGGAGSGDVGSLVGNKGGLASGNFEYRFSFGESNFISLNFDRSVSTHSCMHSQVFALNL